MHTIRSLGTKMSNVGVNLKELRNLSLEGALFLFFSFFVFFQCISIAVANTFLGLSVFVAILIVIKNFKTPSNSELFKNIFDSRYWLGLFSVFWLSMFLSGFFSYESIEGLKKAFNWYVYRTAPFFIILFFFRDSRKSTFFIWLALISCVLDIIVGLFLAPEGSTRLKGIFGHPMTLAGFISISMPILCSYLFDWKQKKSALLLSSVLFFIFLMGLLLNGTRGAWLAVAPAILLVGFCFSIKSWKKLVFLSVICASTIVIFCSNQRFEERALSIASTTLQSNTERLCMWQSAWNMFKDNPIVGVGVGQYAHKYQNEYILPQAKERKQNHAHSNIFQMLGQSGAVGLFGFLTLFLGIFWFGFKTVRKDESPYGIMILACSLSFFIQGLTEFNFGNSAVLKYYLVVLGCFVILSSQKEMLNLCVFPRR